MELDADYEVPGDRKPDALAVWLTLALIGAIMWLPFLGGCG
jgi:hypothetical protein